MGIEFYEIDHTDKLLSELKKLSVTEIHTGFFGDEDAQLPMIAQVNEYGAKMQMTDKQRKFIFAMLNEYEIETSKNSKTGTGYINIPERAFMRKTFDNDEAMREVFDFGIENYNKYEDIHKMLKAMGEKLKAKVQESIRSNIPPANSPLTVAMKGGKNKTLIDTGRLGQGVVSKVV